MQGVSGKSGMRRGKNEVDERGQGPDADAGNRGGRGACGGYKKDETMSVWVILYVFSYIVYCICQYQGSQFIYQVVNLSL